MQMSIFISAIYVLPWQVASSSSGLGLQYLEFILRELPLLLTLTPQSPSNVFFKDERLVQLYSEIPNIIIKQNLRSLQHNPLM